MWPHSIYIRLGDTTVCVGADQPSVIDLLRPWQIPEPDGDDPRSLVDYGVFLGGERGDAPSTGARQLCLLQHGSFVLARYARPAEATDALLRLLSGVARPPEAGQVRLRGIVVEGPHGGAAVLPHGGASELPAGWLRARGLRRVLAEAPLIDTTTLEVIVDPPLGSADTARRLPLRSWWMVARHPEQPVAPAYAVAGALTQVAGDRGTQLAALATLVEQLPPRLMLDSLNAAQDVLLSDW